MDLNLVVLCGRVTAPPELRVLDSGTRLLRVLLSVRSDEPRRRLDVIPVTLWDPPDDTVSADLEPGTVLWVTGSVQRRFWESPEGRRSRLEVVAAQVSVRRLAEAA